MRRRELPGGLAPPTKTALKRQAQAVQELADRLIAAPDAVRARLGLPEKLADAVALARRIGGGGALVRQRQFVAKLIRGLDLGPLRAELDAAGEGARLAAARFRRTERWRDRLMTGGADALAEFCAAHPAADRAGLARLVAAAVAEGRSGRAGAAARALFRDLRVVLEPPPDQ